MNWIKLLFHRCRKPGNVFNPQLGQEIVCLICGTVWIYESRIVEYEVSPAVWDRWADIDKETVTAWWKKDK